LLIERTKSGLARVKATGKTRSGKPVGRPGALSADQAAAVKTALGEGASVSALAREYRTSRATISRAAELGAVHRIAAE
jgi:putative DNA-invertase from lambdoid prophage Rac